MCLFTISKSNIFKCLYQSNVGQIELKTSSVQHPNIKTSQYSQYNEESIRTSANHFCSFIFHVNAGVCVGGQDIDIKYRKRGGTGYFFSIKCNYK